MGRSTKTHEINDFYLEFPRVEVEYEVFPAVYGRPEPDSGGLYLGGPPSLPEQIEIRAVHVPLTKDKKINILNLLSEGDIINLEDDIQSTLHD